MLTRRKGLFSRLLQFDHQRALGWCLERAGYWAFQESPNFRLSRPLFEAALACYPEFGYSLFYLGVLELADGHGDEALAYLDRSWWSHQPHPASPVLARILRSWNRVSEDVPHSQRTSQTDTAEKASFRTLYWLGRDLDRVNASDMASVAFALAADKPTATLTNDQRAQHARCLAEIGRCEEALAEYDSILAAEPSAETRIDRAKALYESVREEEAISELRAVAAGDQEHAARCHCLVGAWQYRRGDYMSAIDAFGAAREAGSNNPGVEVCVACARLRTGDVSAVLDFLRDCPPDERDDPDRLLIEAAVLALQGDEGWLAPLSRLPAERVGDGRSYGTVVWAAKQMSQLRELEQWCNEGDDTHRRYVRYAIGISYYDDQRWADVARVLDPAKATGDTGLAIVLHAAIARLRCGEAVVARDLLEGTLSRPGFEADWLLLTAAALAMTDDEHWMDPLSQFIPKQEAYADSFKTLIWAAQHTSRLEALKAWCESGDDLHNRDMAHFIAEAEK
jgi:tetratricopeptide (TPR) repeat protein